MSYENKGPDRTDDTNDNRDPITGAPGAHPIGTGVGAAAGGWRPARRQVASSARLAPSLARQSVRLSAGLPARVLPRQLIRPVKKPIDVTTTKAGLAPTTPPALTTMDRPTVTA